MLQFKFGLVINQFPEPCLVFYRTPKVDPVQHFNSVSRRCSCYLLQRQFQQKFIYVTKWKQSGLGKFVSLYVGLETVAIVRLVIFIE